MQHWRVGSNGYMMVSGVQRTYEVRHSVVGSTHWEVRHPKEVRALIFTRGAVAEDAISIAAVGAAVGAASVNALALRGGAP
jgi:hypothetical protein